MRDFIKKILLEYSNEVIQYVDFQGFSEPILIPTYNKYLVKFNGTGKFDKIPEVEKIIFKNVDGKEYIFNSDDVQKSGNSPFYVNLDILRKNYDITFPTKFQRHKENLTTNEYTRKLRDELRVYSSKGRCTNAKCSELRDVISNILMEIYGDNYATYVSKGCEPTDGFLNIYPIKNTKDDNQNSWSLLNYVIYKENVVSSLLMSYLKKYGTFEHKDFLDWIYEEKERLFKGEFLNLMLRNLEIPKGDLTGQNLFIIIKKLFPKAELVGSYCPSTRKNYNQNIIVDNDGEKIIFQPVEPKNSQVLKLNGKYYLLFSRRTKSPIINRRADFIITLNGTVFENSRVVVGDRTWEFPNPPIYSRMPYQTELKKNTKLK